ncbi:MAG: T9SS type A sorting domain-containing protein [Flavobacteriales bacterium]|nr:T9SS type A sorting domain-containing protein [Flavobacteriales bacterium]
MKNQIFKAATLAVCIFISDFTLYAQEGGAQSGPNIQPLCNSQFTFEPCMNLVRNPSFSIYVPGTSPVWDALHNISGACPWTTAIKTNPAETHTSDIHAGTPNVFHQDITYASNSVPANFAGSSTDEVPNTVCGEDDQYYNNGSGNIQAYAGLYGYATTINGLDGTPYSYSDYREFIQQKLSAPLTAGKTYTVNIRVKLGTNSNRAVPLGILFSPVRPDYPAQTGYTGVVSTAGGTLLSIPAVSNKTTWQTVTFSYTHTGAPMQYITIGNFKTDAQLTSDGEITTVPPSASTGQQVFAYYFIDDIAVFETGEVCCQASSNTGFAPCAYPTVNTLQPQIGGSENGCAANTYTVLNAGQYPAGTLFTWTYSVPGGTPVTGSGTSFSLNASQTAAGGLLTLTATPPYGCPAETKLQIKSCCVPDGYTGNNATTYLATGAPGSNKASDMLAHFGGTVPFYAQIAINGLFTVDVNMHWEEVDVVFGENAKVVLNNNIHLSIEKSHLYACDKMWEGLEADHPSEKISLYKGSLLEHAYTGINSINGADIQVHNSTLNRNRNHIGIVFYSGTEHPARITANTFTCKNLSTGVLQTLPAPMQNEHTAFGITALAAGGLTVGRDVNFVLVGTPNKFEYADVHISAAYTGLEVKNAEFKLPLNWTPPSPLAGGILNITKGVAIYAYGPDGTASTQQLLVGGPGGEACSFDGFYFNQRRGAAIVSMNNIDVTVRNCGFTRLKYGVVVNKLTGWQSVSGNVVTQHGMNLLVNTSTFTDIDSCGVYGVVYNRAGVTVQQNTFTGMGHKGVYFGNVTSPSLFSGYLIQDNSIAGDRMTHGVHLINCSRAKVLANTVQFTAAPVGFYTMGSTTRYGIRTEGCSRLQIIDNQVRRTNTTISGVFSNTNYLRLQGINVAACPGATVCNNTLERLGTGMRFMLNNAGIRIRLNKMFSDHTGVNLYQANINQPTTDGTIPWDNEWSNIVGGNTNRRIEGNISTFTVWRWRNDGILNSNFNPQTHQVFPEIWFSMQGSNPAQYITCFNTGVPTIAPPDGEREALYGAVVDSALVYEEGEGTLEFMDEKYAYLALADDSALWATQEPEDDKFRTFVLDRETETVGYIKEAADKELADDKTAALGAVGSITAVTQHEEFEKTVLDIYLRRWMRDTASFDSTEMDILLMIAGLSYAEGGPAVLGARVLLGGEAVDFESKKGSADAGTENPAPRAVVFPNPNQGLVSFRVDDAPGAFTFELFSLSGMRLLMRPVSQADIHRGVYLNGLTDGVYLYKITFEDGKTENGKLILIKP